MKKLESRAEVSTTCPNCGQVLVRPADFSAERLMYLHQKWGPCFPMGRGAREHRPSGASPDDSAVVVSRSAAG